MTIGLSDEARLVQSSCDEAPPRLLLPEVPHSAHLALLEQLSADLIEISQRKHGLRPCQVLGQAAYLTLAKPHSCLTMRRACSPRARSPRTRRLIIRQRALSGR